ncbi:olfactory receptor class A-like protein 4 [Acipenser ruthenus]|uniref:olfactory receptor class A-like protein 4 n=1 Tax=Acipenser ruthenus TaxID=7906 RepID=UPI00145B424B|nr:olfactory receptor class A-like protein 4 [Acipenser ruthenus]
MVRSVFTQSSLYGLLVLLGVVGNVLVAGILSWGFLQQRSIEQSDFILLNMALSNLLVSFFRNILLFLSGLGMEAFLSQGWCKIFMCLWVWFRSVNVWMTFCLSAFHFAVIRRNKPAPSAGLAPGHASQELRRLLLVIGLVWVVNLIYSLPLLMFSTRGSLNSTETLMVISSTTRPLLGCVWNFPSRYSGLAFATVSLVVHEALPIILMLGTNLATLYRLGMHGRSVGAVQESLPRRVPAERKAAKVILLLIVLFIVPWGTSLVSLNYYNYNRGPSGEYLVVIATFSNSLFIALSPLVLAAGHSKLRSKLKHLLKRGGPGRGTAS